MDIFAPGNVVHDRSCLWHMDGQEGDILVAPSIDGGEAEQSKLYLPSRMFGRAISNHPV